MEYQHFRTFAAIGSVVLTAIVLELIRRRKLKDELWLAWLLVALTPLAASIWLRPWELIARWLGIVYEPALLLGLGILLCVSMILYLTVVISGLMRRNLQLAQDVALLRHTVDALAADRPPERE